MESTKHEDAKITAKMHYNLAFGLGLMEKKRLSSRDPD
jgi:hypothetical protein